jgi:hypothetical protein
MERGERRSAFVRTVLDHIGKDGWELAGVHPLWPAETSYMIFKRQATGEKAEEAEAPAEEAKGDKPDNGPKKGDEGGEPTRSMGDKTSEMV